VISSLYLALAYLRPKRHLLSVINLLAVAGTLIGVMMLVVVISVMNGFDEMWREKILTFQPHVTLFSYPYGLQEEDPLFEELRGMEGVTEVSPFIQSIVMAQSEYAMDHPMIRGVDPEEDFLYRTLSADTKNGKLVAGTFALDDLECVIGVDLARNLGVRVGETLSVFSPATFAKEGEILLPEDLEVVGIFQVGMYQIDSGFILTDLQTARDVLGMQGGVHGIQILGQDLMGANELAKRIEQESEFQYEARSWMQMNQQLFNALTMEKGMMFFLLTLISLVASFLVTSTLIMVSVQKTREIGLLKSMGFRNSTVMLVFMFYGLIQGVVGILAGIGTGLLVLAQRENLLSGLSRLVGYDVLPKELYYLDTLPSKVVLEDVARIGGMVLVLCLVAGVVPAWLAARKNPVEALRHD
jgi:lipoprotein-releasing system permease protein